MSGKRGRGRRLDEDTALIGKVSLAEVNNVIMDIHDEAVGREEDCSVLCGAIGCFDGEIIGLDNFQSADHELFLAHFTKIVKSTLV